MITMLLVGLVLAAGIATVGTAVFYAISPSDRRLTLLRPLSLTTLFAGLGGTANGALVILRGAAATSTWSPAGRGALLAGCAEAVVPLVGAFTLLAVGWGLASVGMVRANRP